MSVTSQGYRYAAYMLWDPDQYELFTGPRTRPAVDLLRSFEADSPETVVDLGCGTGHLTAALAGRWPSAGIVGVDKSSSMLARAAKQGGEITWVEADIAEWHPPREVDVIFSNAALQWLDDHRRLFPRLAGFLSPRSVLAVQMPDNGGEPSHCVAIELASGSKWGSRLRSVVRLSPLLSSGEYTELLEDHFDEVEIWRTTYVHVLDGEHAVSEWVQGSFLKPFLDALDEEDAAAFLAEYRTLIRPAYETLADGRTLFPFSRLFIVARRLHRA